MQNPGRFTLPRPRRERRSGHDNLARMLITPRNGTPAERHCCPNGCIDAQFIHGGSGPANGTRIPLT